MSSRRARSSTKRISPASGSVAATTRTAAFPGANKDTRSLHTSWRFPCRCSWRIRDDVGRQLHRSMLRRIHHVCGRRRTGPGRLGLCCDRLPWLPSGSSLGSTSTSVSSLGKRHRHRSNRRLASSRRAWPSPIPSKTRGNWTPLRSIPPSREPRGVHFPCKGVPFDRRHRASSVASFLRIFDRLEGPGRLFGVPKGSQAG